MNGARVDPKVAVLKPLSAAIAIGSGGPFGAEGPIIMTGGAFGSLVAQWLKLSMLNGQHCWWPVPLRGCQQLCGADCRDFACRGILLFEWRPRRWFRWRWRALADALRFAGSVRGRHFPFRPSAFI